MMKVNARDVESATDVKPIGWTNNAFIAETQNLPARQGIYPTCLRTTYLRIGLPKRPLVLIGIGIGDVVIEVNTSILHFAIEQQPLLGLNAQLHAQAVQVIEIIRASEPDSRRTLKTTTKFATDADPVGQRLVQLDDG